MVKVYRNLHKQCWSIMDHTGRVAHHAERVLLRNGSFVVRPGGRAKVLATRRKVVHAFAKGLLQVWMDEPPNNAREVSYNPYKFGHFYDKATNERIDNATHIWLNGAGKVFVQ